MFDLYPADIAKLSRSDLEQAAQGRTQTMYLGDGVVLARVLTRYKMLLHTTDRGFGNHVAMDGFWEIWITQFFARTLKPGMCVVDVGANYGYYTMLFADCTTSTGQVLAVEPNPNAAGLLRQSIQLNGFGAHTRVVEAALGATPNSSARLFVPNGEPKNAHISEYTGSEGTAHTVALTTLDDLVVGLDRVDMVKIDAEGAEEAIVAGMAFTLSRHRPGVVLEFNTGRCADPAALLDRLLAVYGGVSVIDSRGMAVPVDREIVLTTRNSEDWMLYFAGRET